MGLRNAETWSQNNVEVAVPARWALDPADAVPARLSDRRERLGQVLP